MADLQDVITALRNADAAGDAEAARALASIANKMMGGADSAPQSGSVAATGNLTPRAYDPSEDVEARTPDRFGDTIEKATEAPRQMTKVYAAGVADADRSPTMQNLPDWVPEGARRPLSVAGDVAMTGIGVLGTAYSAGAGLVGEIAGGTPTQERKLARDLMMMGEVAVPELAGVSSVSVANRSAAQAVKRAEKGLSPAMRGARAASDLGITPSLGAGGKVRAMTAATLEKMPLAGGVIGDDAARFVGEVEQAAQRITAKIGTARNASDAGAALQSGLGKFVTNFKTRSGQLFDDVAKHIPRDTRVAAPSTVRAIREAVEPFKNNPEIAQQLGLNKWARLADDLDNGMTWEAATRLRSSIGESIGKINGPLADMDQGRLKRVYAQLTDDLASAASQAGPDAERAWTRAQTYYKSGAERISKQLDKTISAQSPERAFEAFAAMAKKDRASADVRRMAAIKSSMPKDEWREVSASIIDRLGRASPGAQNAAGDAFSPASFLTEWNKLSNEAKNILLPKSVRSELDKLADVAERVKAANAERNFSNTGTAISGAAVGAGAVADLGTTAAIVGGAWGSAKTLTNPAMLRALNRMAMGDTSAMQRLSSGRGALAVDARTILRMTAAESAQGGAAANATAEPFYQAVK